MSSERGISTKATSPENWSVLIGRLELTLTPLGVDVGESEPLTALALGTATLMAATPPGGVNPLWFFELPGALVFEDRVVGQWTAAQQLTGRCEIGLSGFISAMGREDICMIFSLSLMF